MDKRLKMPNQPLQFEKICTFVLKAYYEISIKWQKMLQERLEAFGAVLIRETKMDWKNRQLQSNLQTAAF